MQPGYGGRLGSHVAVLPRILPTEGLLACSRIPQDEACSANASVGCERAEITDMSPAMNAPDSIWSYVFRVVVPILAIAGGIFTYFVRKHSEERSVNKAILAEINRLITAVRRHHDWWTRLPSPAPHPLIPFSYAVYKQQVKNVGVLREDLVGAVVQFYGYLQFLNDLQSRRKRFENQADFESIYKNSLKNFLDLFEHRFDAEFMQQSWTLESQGTHSTWKV